MNMTLTTSDVAFVANRAAACSMAQPIFQAGTRVGTPGTVLVRDRAAFAGGGRTTAGITTSAWNAKGSNDSTANKRNPLGVAPPLPT